MVKCLDTRMVSNIILRAFFFLSQMHSFDHFLNYSIENTLIKKLQCILKEDLKMQEQENTGPVRHRM